DRRHQRPSDPSRPGCRRAAPDRTGREERRVMAAGLGYFDPNGVWQFGEDDTEVLFSDLLNKGQQATSAAIALDRARLDDLEADTGWVQITTFVNGWTAIDPVFYRVLGGIVFWR